MQKILITWDDCWFSLSSELPKNQVRNKKNYLNSYLKKTFLVFAWASHLTRLSSTTLREKQNFPNKNDFL